MILYGEVNADCPRPLYENETSHDLVKICFAPVLHGLIMETSSKIAKVPLIKVFLVNNTFEKLKFWNKSIGSVIYKLK